jgi:hypothetical protein
MIEIKACPFCGGMAELRYSEHSVKVGYYVTCVNPECNVEVYTFKFQTIEEAADAWNKRITNEIS